jgi:hypothetical protein
MKSFLRLVSLLLFAIVATLFATDAPKDRPRDQIVMDKDRPRDRIVMEVAEVHMAVANVGGGTRITSSAPKPRNSDTKVGDDLDRDPRVGDRMIIRGTYTLVSRDKARLSIVLSQPKGKAAPTYFPLPSVEIQKGSGKFELTYDLTREGFLSLAYFSIPEGKRFLEHPMTPILPMWAGDLGPEKPVTETPASDTPRSP